MKRTVYYPLMGLATIGLVAVYGAFLFGIAGRWDLPMFYAYLISVGLLSAVGMLGTDPDLLKERARPGPGARDYRMIPIAKVMLMAHLVIAPLDVGRYHWSWPMPLWLQIAGLVLFTAGLGLFIWCMVINRFFSTVVRHQIDRGHHLIDTGPYRYVRHPGYAGLIPSMLASGVALGSWWSMVPLVAFSLLIVRRLFIEDRFLHEHLEGYPEYARRVRFRIIPGVC